MIKQILEDYLEEDLLIADGFDNAIIGIAIDFRSLGWYILLLNALKY